MLEEGSGKHVDCANLCSRCSLLVSKHLEVVLEHINELIALERLLNTVSDTVDKLFKLIICSAIGSLSLLLHLIKEILWIILDYLVHHTIEVGLSLESLDLSRCLKTNLQGLLLGKETCLGDLDLEIRLAGISFNETVPVLTELLPWTRYTDPHQSSI